MTAGVDQVFVGMENINPDNLIGGEEERRTRSPSTARCFSQWKKHPVVITAGYIIGFPNDTRESILHDIEVIKRELPIDLIYFTNLTPLPGCEDHQRLHGRGAGWIRTSTNTT